MASLLVMAGMAAGTASTVATAAGAAAMIGGTLMSAAGSAQAGEDTSAVAEYNAKQTEAAGKAEFATKQREAIETERQKEIKLSRARAVGAAGGGGIDFDLLGDIEAEGTYNALTSLWEGEEAMKGRNAQAAGSRFEGKQAKRAGKIKASNTILSGGASILSKYG